jgi:hypothetical protein
MVRRHLQRQHQQQHPIHTRPSGTDSKRVRFIPCATIQRVIFGTLNKPFGVRTTGTCTLAFRSLSMYNARVPRMSWELLYAAPCHAKKQ